MTSKDYQLIVDTLRAELDDAIGNEEAFGSRAIVSTIKRLSESFALNDPRFNSEEFERACGIGSDLPPARYSVKV